MAVTPVGMALNDPQASAEAVTRMQHCAEEARVPRDQWVEFADTNNAIFLTGTVDPPKDGQIVVNEIQTAIINSNYLQSKEEPSVTLEPVETGEPPNVYWFGPRELGQFFGLTPQNMGRWQDATGQVRQPVPVDPMAAERLMQMVGTPLTLPNGQTIQISPSWVVAVDDRFVADFYQSVYDVYWTRSNTRTFLRRNTLNKDIHGWSWGLYEFDDDRKRHVQRNVSIRQVYIDPTAEDVADAAYAGADLVYDAEDAKRLYPNIADEIDAAAQTGIPYKPDTSTRYGEGYERDFKRKTVTMRVFWYRNQPLPLDAEHAAGLGLVQRAAPTNPMPRIADDDTPPGSDAAGLPDGAAGSPTADAGTGTPADDATPPADPVYTIDGEPADHTHEKWPVRYVVQEQRAIAGILVHDAPAEHWDIPLVLNVNVPVPFQPFGIGEPYRLIGLQASRSRILDNVVKHTDYFSSPLGAMPESVALALEAEYGDAYANPGRTLRIPDAMWTQMGGKIDAFYEPPPISESLIEVQQILKAEINDQSGHPEVMQGSPGPDVKSGVAISLLQSGAASSSGFKGQRTEDVVERLAHLQLYSLATRLTTDDLMKVVKKYPRAIVEEVQRRALSIDWTISVSIAAGTGAIKAQKRAQAAQDLGIGAISMQTYQEAAGIDRKQEQQRKATEQQAAMVAAPTQPQPTTRGQPPARK